MFPGWWHTTGTGSLGVFQYPCCIRRRICLQLETDPRACRIGSVPRRHWVRRISRNSGERTESSEIGGTGWKGWWLKVAAFSSLAYPHTHTQNDRKMSSPSQYKAQTVQLYDNRSSNHFLYLIIYFAYQISQ